MRRTLAAIALLVLSAGCDSTQPNPLAGTWVATQFTHIDGNNPHASVLGAGGSLTITIESNNETSGTLVIPAGFAELTPGTVSMAGTVSENDPGEIALVLQFHQQANSFVRDAGWIKSGNTLSTIYSIGSQVTLLVTLTRE